MRSPSAEALSARSPAASRSAQRCASWVARSTSGSSAPSISEVLPRELHELARHGVHPVHGDQAARGRRPGVRRDVVAQGQVLQLETQAGQRGAQQVGGALGEVPLATQPVLQLAGAGAQRLGDRPGLRDAGARQVEVEAAAAQRLGGDRELAERRGERPGDEVADQAGQHRDHQEQHPDRPQVAAEDVANHRRGLADRDRAIRHRRGRGRVRAGAPGGRVGVVRRAEHDDRRPVVGVYWSRSSAPTSPLRNARSTGSSPARRCGDQLGDQHRLLAHVRGLLLADQVAQHVGPDRAGAEQEQRGEQDEGDGEPVTHRWVRLRGGNPRLERPRPARSPRRPRASASAGRS